jgi:hypothetical protein
VEHQEGGIFAHRYQSATKKFFSLGMAELRHIVNYLRSKYDANMRAKTEKITSDMVKGVRVNCVGEEAVFQNGIAMMEQLEIAMPDKNEDQWSSPAASKIGLPLVITKCVPGISWRGRTFDGYPSTSNQFFLPLTMRNTFDLNLLKDRAFSGSDHARLHPGSINMLRHDKRPMLISHVIALGIHFTDAFKEHEGQCIRMNVPIDFDTYLDSLSKVDFLKIWETMMDEFKESDPELIAAMRSPYDM